MRRGQRLSRAELIQESRELLTDIGTPCHTRAQYLQLLGSAVVGSENPLFVRLQPVPHPKNSIAWAQAYALLIQYLSWFELSATLETVETESGEPTPEIPLSNPEDQFEDLISLKTRKIPFKERVDALLTTRLRRPNQTPSPKATGKRGPGGKPQTPLQKRPTKPPKSGKNTPTSFEKQAQSPIRIVTSPRKSGRDLLESEELSDIVVTDIIEKPRRRK